MQIANNHTITTQQAQTIIGQLQQMLTTSNTTAHSPPTATMQQKRKFYQLQIEQHWKKKYIF